MRTLLCVLGLMIITGCSIKSPSNYAECILQGMPGASNESARLSVHRQCSTKFPARYDEIKKGSGLGFGAKFDNSDQCIIEKNKNTINRNATTNINMACSCLYEKPLFDDQMCSSVLVRVK